MYSAIVMAGQKNSKERQEFYDSLSSGYKNDNKVINGYKALIEFPSRNSDGIIEKKPSLQYVLEKLWNSDNISDVVVVGNQPLIEHRLGYELEKSPKKTVIVDQRDIVDSSAFDIFNLGDTLISDSILGNATKGYMKSDSYVNNLSDEKERYAIFIAADSPLTTQESIDSVIIESEQNLIPNSSLIFPLANMKKLPFWRQAFHRKYLFLNNDTEYQFDNSFRTFFGNDGFRLSSFVFADPVKMNLDMVNWFYSHRKMNNAVIRQEAFDFLKENNLGHYIKKYFNALDKLSIVELSDALSPIFMSEGEKLTILPIRDDGSSYDVDTDQDISRVNYLMKQKKSINN